MEEFELTYLAKEVPEGVRGSAKKEMVDIYVPSTSAHPTLRIRKQGARFEMTKKEPVKGNDSSHMLETTIPLREDEFEELATVKGKRVEKTRFYYTENAVGYEVDVFRGDLAGLVLIDVEFTSNEEKARFKAPAWCLAEVTQEKFLAGGMVCGKKYADLEKDLARYSYKKLRVDF